LLQTHYISRDYSSEKALIAEPLQEMKVVQGMEFGVENIILYHPFLHPYSAIGAICLIYQQP
jgi:hypothetical protein